MFVIFCSIARSLVSCFTIGKDIEVDMLASIEKLKGYEPDLLRRTESSIWDYYDMLLCYAEYEQPELVQERTITYEDMNSVNLTGIRKRFGIHKLSENDDEIKYLAYLKKMAYENLHFRGNTLKDRSYDSLSVEDMICTAKQEGYALNCRYISHIFCQILLSVGFKARWVVCLPMDLMNSECHCVTEVYIKALNKWVIADAALGTFYFGEKGEMLNLYEMRKLYINRKVPVIVVERAEDAKEIQLYWIKNIFRFRFTKYNGTNALQCEQHYWGVNPKGFKLNDKSYTDRYCKIKTDITYCNDVISFW